MHDQDSLSGVDLMSASTLERMRHAVQDNGSIYTHHHICDLAMGTVPAEHQDPGSARLEINDTHTANHDANLLDHLGIRIGHAEAGHRIARWEQQSEGSIISGDRRRIHQSRSSDTGDYPTRQLTNTVAGTAVLGKQQTRGCPKILPQHFDMVSINGSCHWI